jgi:putative endonuclease
VHEDSRTKVSGHPSPSFRVGRWGWGHSCAIAVTSPATAAVWMLADAWPGWTSSSPVAGPAAAAAKLWRMSEAWVYLLRCRDGSLYTGWTVDVERRLARHRAGVASRYTASRLPVDLELALPMPDRTAARREEARIKRLSRAQKLALVKAAAP